MAGDWVVVLVKDFATRKQRLGRRSIRPRAARSLAATPSAPSAAAAGGHRLVWREATRSRWGGLAAGSVRRSCSSPARKARTRPRSAACSTRSRRVQARSCCFRATCRSSARGGPRDA